VYQCGAFHLPAFPWEAGLQLFHVALLTKESDTVLTWRLKTTSVSAEFI